MWPARGQRSQGGGGHAWRRSRPSRFLSARSYASALGKPALLASRATAPACEPNHAKPPITAILAERPTPGSKLPSATKREQALALEKRCGPSRFTVPSNRCDRLAPQSLQRRPTQAIRPQTSKPLASPIREASFSAGHGVLSCNSTTALSFSFTKCSATPSTGSSTGRA